MHILLHLSAFILLVVWIIGYFYFHAPFVIHFALVLALILFAVALYKRPAKREV